MKVLSVTPFIVLKDLVETERGFIVDRTGGTVESVPPWLVVGFPGVVSVGRG